MRRISYPKAALSVGGVIVIYHLAWLSLVAAGAAKGVMDFILRLHFVALDYSIAPFDLATATALLALTFAIGAAFGLVFAAIWNGIGRSESD